MAYNGTVLAGLIEAFLGPEAIPLAALVGVLSWDTASFCAADPPAIPTITTADVASLFTESITGVAIDPTATAKFSQLLNHLAWFQLCECATSATPSVGTVSWPGGSAINPSGLTTSGSACGDATTGVNLNSPTGTFVVSGFTWGEVDLVPVLFPNMPNRLITDPSTGLANVAISLGSTPPTSLTLTVSDVTLHDTSSDSRILQVRLWDSAATIISPGGSPNLSFSASAPPAFPFTNTFVVPSTARFATITAQQPQSHPPTTYNARVQWICPNTSNFNSPCCPPDPVVQQLLQRILTLTTLMQRQTAPFAYVGGASHTGLSGAGDVAVQGLLGVKVTPTTIPSQYGSEAGDPESLWLDSWIRWGNADGWSERQFLTASPYVSLPNLAGQYTKVGYTLAPGIVADIQELVREA